MSENDKSLSKLAQAIKDQLTSLGWKSSQLAEELGMSSAGVNKWLNGGLVSTKHTERLANFLGKTIGEIEKWDGWSGRKTKEAKTPKILTPSDEFSAALELMKPEYIHSHEEAVKNMANLFLKMDAEHILIITTFNTQPAGFQPVSYKVIVDAAYEAMKKGALIAYIVPSEKTVDHLREYAPYEELVHEHSAFKSDFAVWAKGYADFLQIPEGVDGTKEVYEKTQLFECDFFPLTPCGRTVSLLVKSPPFGTEGESWILERTPLTNNHLCLMKKNMPDIDLLREFVRKIISNPTSRVKFVKEEIEERAYNTFRTIFRNRLSYNSGHRPAT